MRKLSSIALLILVGTWVVVSSMFPVLAKGDTIKTEYKLTPQYPWAKSFKVILFLYPTKDVQRVEVRWSKSDVLTVKPASKVIHVSEGEKEYVADFKITPKRKGRILLHASVIYYSGVSTFVDSVDIPLEFDSYLRLPPGPNHLIYSLIFYVGIFILSLLVVFGFYKLFNFVVYDYFPRWLARKTSQPI